MTWIAECRNSIRTTLDLQNHLDSTFLLQEKKFMFLWIHATLPGVITRLPRRRLVEGKAKLRTNFQIYIIYHISIIYIYVDIHIYIYLQRKEVWKSTFGQYGEMKTREEKSRRETGKKSEERRYRRAKC